MNFAKVVFGIPNYSQKLQNGHISSDLEVSSFSAFEHGDIFITTGVIQICGLPMMYQVSVRVLIPCVEIRSFLLNGDIISHYIVGR